VSIAKNGREVIKVKLEGAPAPAAVKGENGAFVLLGGTGVADRKFDTLANAVQRANDGDTIEIRASGPFITDPIMTKHALTIRATDGARPVFKLRADAAEAGADHLETRAPLVLEGLELQLMTKVPRKAGARWQTIIHSSNAPLRIANCRLLFDESWGGPIGWSSVIKNQVPICELRNCEMINLAGFGMGATFHPDLKLSVVNCCCVHQSPAVRINRGQNFELDDEPLSAKEATVRLTHNTFISHGHTLGLQLWHDKDRADKQQHNAVRIATFGNIYDARSSVLAFVQQESPKALSPAQAEAFLPQMLTWQGERNLYAVGGPFLTLGIAGTTFQRPAPANPVSNLADWRQFWGAAEPDSIEGPVRYQGGDLLSRLAERS
jgi:hypothetical protein